MHLPSLRTLLVLAAFAVASCSGTDGAVQERRIAVNGTELFVKTMGSGPPLVVLHGGPGLSHDYFLPHLAPLADSVQLVLFDQRGMGRSSTQLDSTTFTLDLLVEDIEALRRALELEQIHLLGHSWGGMLAMRYAIAYPDRLKSLVLSNSVPASSEFTEATFEAFARANERQDRADVEPLQQKIEQGTKDVSTWERYMQLTYRPLFYDTAAVRRLQLNLSDSYFRTQELLQYLPPPTEPVDLLPDLASVTVPTLIVRAEMEPIPLASDRRLLETLPNARLESIDRAGHFPFIEQPEAFAALVGRFVRSHP